MIEAIALSIITAALFYAIQKIDHIDRRCDHIEQDIARLFASMPKRKTDNNSYFIENSGIDL